MNKKEFKELYAPARLIRGASYGKGAHNTPAETISWNICHDVISGLHPAVSEAVWGWQCVWIRQMSQ